MEATARKRKAGAVRAAPPSEEEYEEKELLSDLEAELRQVKALKTRTQQHVARLLREQKQLEQQQRRQQRQQERRGAGAATARMLQLQEQERERLAAAEEQRQRLKQETLAREQEAQRQQQHTIQTQPLDGDLADLDAFLVDDAACF